jgi:hypothetical protein
MSRMPFILVVAATYAAIGRGPQGEDDYHWVCDECFADFRDRFGWTVVESEG